VVRLATAGPSAGPTSGARGRRGFASLVNRHFGGNRSEAIRGGTCLQDLELLRHDEVLLDALGARRLPDPTTAGDFCRRFTEDTIQRLQDIIDDTRLRVWAQQPRAYFEQAILDMDGLLVETTGQCKQGMEIAYDGTWGNHPLVVTLANTGETMRVVNRSGNRPSAEGAAAAADQALRVCLRGGFWGVLLRGGHQVFANRALGSLGQRSPRTLSLWLRGQGQSNRHRRGFAGSGLETAATPAAL
jgi:hypothetical protein